MHRTAAHNSACGSACDCTGLQHVTVHVSVHVTVHVAVHVLAVDIRPCVY